MNQGSSSRRRNLASQLGLALLLATCALTRAAHADEYDALLTRAVAAKERAIDQNDPAAWQEALDLFVKADRARSTKEAKYELASAAARLRQDDLAVEAYAAALELGLEGTARDKAAAFVREKQPEMGRLEVVGPAGAEVLVGERSRGRLPLARPIVVFAGLRSVRVTLGDASATRQLEVGANQTARLDFGPSLTAPASPSGPDRAVPPGPEPDVRTSPPSGPSPLAWPLTIGGGSLALVGGVTLLAASSNLSSHRDRLASVCAEPDGTDACRLAEAGKRSEAQDEVDSIATWKSVRTGGWVGLGVGVAAAGVGVVLLLSGSESRQPPAAFGIGPASAGTGLSIYGQL